jgi:hypothetical protein
MVRSEREPSERRDRQSSDFYGTLSVMDLDSLATIEDLRGICATLISRLPQCKGAYLVIDGFDRLRRSVQTGLNDHLRSLGLQELRVLLFRAVPEFEPFSTKIVKCDGCSSVGEDGHGLLMYWHCELCDHDLCDPCRMIGGHCKRSDHHMAEPYNHVHIRLDTAVSELKRFVKTDLEAEYGTASSDSIVEEICDRSSGNVNLAKLRLDQIRDLELPSDILSVTDRLPREVVAFFDTQVQSISRDDLAQWYQTLMAIVFVAEAGGLSVNKLEEKLSLTNSLRSDESGGSYPLVRRALDAARGLLSTMTERGVLSWTEQETDRHKVVHYHRDLGYYVREDYNQDLVLAKQHLYQAQKVGSGLDRSESFERAVRARKSGDGGLPGNLPEREAGEFQRPWQSLINAILTEPGAICERCQRVLLKSTLNEGNLHWSPQDQHTDCMICLYAQETIEAETKGVMVLKLHWSRRTTGRTSHSNNHLVLTLEAEDVPGPASKRRFVFMLKSEVGSAPKLKDLGKSTHFEHTGRQIKRWLQTCKFEHVQCTLETANTYVPKRLVDLETSKPGLIRVIEKHDKKPGHPYVTLSHSWGKSPSFLRLTTENKDRLRKEFPVADLENKNFEEAINVARYMEMRYIWIDSLCICQEGKEKDFKEEGQYMHLVYQNSFCNIVAADSKDGNGGLFRQRPSSSLSGTDTKGSWVVLDKELWAKELLQSPIYKRGWVFQGKAISHIIQTTLMPHRTNAFSTHHSLHTFPGILGL